MGLVLWIDENVFSTSLLEKSFKQADVPFYSLENVNDFSYLVDDLKPSLIVLDGKTYDQGKELFMQQFLSSNSIQKTPFIFIDPVPGMEFTTLKLGQIQRPFDPFQIPDVVRNFLTVN